MSTVPLKKGKKFKSKSQKDSVIITDDMYNDAAVFLECPFCDVGINRLGIVVREDTSHEIKIGKVMTNSNWNKCKKRIEAEPGTFTVHCFIPPEFAGWCAICIISKTIYNINKCTRG